MLSMLFLFSCILLSCIFSYQWYSRIPSKLPPGPKGFPLVGCIPYIHPSTAHLTMHKWSKKYGNLISFYMGNTLVIVLGDYQVIKEALIKQGELFNGRSVIRAFRAKDVAQGLGLTGAEGDLWREQRSFCLKALKDFGVGRSILEPKIRQEVQFLLDAISKSNGKPLDLKMLLHYAVSNVIVQLVFGQRFDYDDPTFIDYLHKLTFRLTNSGINAMSTFNFFPTLLAFFQLNALRTRVKTVLKDSEVILNFIRRFISEKGSKFDDLDDPEDYMTAFLKAQKNGDGRHFHEDQLLISVQQLFIAGSETSATVLRWAIWYMATYPEYQEKVYREISEIVGTEYLPSWSDHGRMPFTEASICEILRVSNLAPLAITHRTMEDTMLMGYFIPKDSYVIPLLWAVHMDPRYFPEPEKFKPERFIDCNGQFMKHPACIPFSIGKRTCLGESLAKMELFIFFAAMIQKFRFRFPDRIHISNGKWDSCPVVVGVLISPASFDVIAEPRNQ